MIDPDHPGANDCHRPPDVPTLVHCLHCHQEYDSYLMIWRSGRDGKGGKDDATGCWCCATAGCEGRGFGSDIVAVDPECESELDCWIDDDDFADVEDFDPEWDAELDAWEQLEPEFDQLMGGDLHGDGCQRVDGIIGDPMPDHVRHYDDLDEEDIPF